MTNKEIVNRNLSLTFDFVKHLIDNPDLINKLPDYSELSFLDKDFIIGNDKPAKSGNSKKAFIKVKNSFEITK